MQQNIGAAAPGSKIFSSNFIKVFFVQFCIMFESFLLISTLANYTIDSFLTAENIAGIIIGTMTLCSIVSRFLAGKFIDIIGRRKLFRIALVAHFVVTALYFFTMNIAWLESVRVMHGLAYGVMSVCTSTISISFIPSDRLSEGIGYYSTCIPLASALGPFLGLTVVRLFGNQAVFLLIIGVSAVALICGLTLKINNVELSEDERKEMSSMRWDTFIEKRVLKISIITLCLFVINASVMSFLSEYSAMLNMETTASIYFIVMAIATIVVRIGLGKVADKYGPEKMIIPGFILICIHFIMIGWAAHPACLIISAALNGMGMGLIQPNCMAIAVSSVPRHRTGLANSTFLSFLDLGTGIAPFLAGYLIMLVGFKTMYFTYSLIALMYIVFFYFLILRPKLKAKKAEGTSNEQE